MTFSLVFLISGPRVICLFVELLLPRGGCPCVPVQRPAWCATHSNPCVRPKTSSSRRPTHNRNHEKPCTESARPPQKMKLPEGTLEIKRKRPFTENRTHYQPFHGHVLQGNKVFPGHATDNPPLLKRLSPSPAPTCELLWFPQTQAPRTSAGPSRRRPRAPASPPLPLPLLPPPLLPGAAERR